MALVVKDLPTNEGDTRDTGLIPQLGRSLGGGHGNSLQHSCLENPMDRGACQFMVRMAPHSSYSCLENPMDGGAWWAAVHGVTKSRTWLSDFTFTYHFHALEKEMATHFSVLAWRIPGTGEPGGLPSMGSHRVGHDWSDLAAAAAESQRVRQDWSDLACTQTISIEFFKIYYLNGQRKSI